MLSISSSAPSALPSAPPSSAQVSSTASSSNNKYDPVYCLSEHLDYFSESVADLLAGDFDVIFGGSEEAQQVAASSACVPQVSSLAETANGYTQYSKKLRLASPQDEPFRLPSVQEVVSVSSCSTTQSMTQQMSTFPTILAPKPMKVPNPIESFMTASTAESSTATAGPVSIAPYMVSPVSSVSKSITSNLYGTTGMVTPISSNNSGYGLVSASNSDDESAMNNATTTTNKPSATKKSRKRQINTADVSEEESVLSTLPSKNTGRKLDKGEREDVRRERNRQHAKRSRQRKREFTNELEGSVQALKAENEELFRMLGVNTSVVQKREEEMQVKATEHFVEALKCPENRVLDDDALSALRGLFQ